MQGLWGAGPQDVAVTDRLAIIEEGGRLADAKQVIKVTEGERDRETVTKLWPRRTQTGAESDSYQTEVKM